MIGPKTVTGIFCCFVVLGGLLAWLAHKHTWPKAYEHIYPPEYTIETTETNDLYFIEDTVARSEFVEITSQNRLLVLCPKCGGKGGSLITTAGELDTVWDDDK